MTRVSSTFYVLLLFAVVAVVKVHSEDNLLRKRRKSFPALKQIRENQDYSWKPVIKAFAGSDSTLIRKKREWILPPKPLTENQDHTNEKSIAKIRTDFDSGKGNIKYYLEGIGATEYPFNVFVVNPDTGEIRVTKILDREFIDTYNLTGIARYKNGSFAEKSINLRIKVVDENDNPPKFQPNQYGEVKESSPAGTFVMKVTATDADEAGTNNSKIAYRIVDQNPPGMFYIDSNGNVFVKQSSLDRESTPECKLTVIGQDLGGKPGGNTATSTVTVKLLDVNDNLPTLEKDEYEGSIEENTAGVEVMRIKAQDLDLEHTENWDAVFKIVQGNEAGYFSIKTDPKTNEGILMLDKAMNYEDVKDLQLGLAVMNKAKPFDASGVDIGTAAGGGGTGAGGGGAGGGGAGGGGAGGGGAGGSAPTGGGSALAGGGSAPTGGGPSLHSETTTKYKTYPIKINVLNQHEGPKFLPTVKAIPISEGGHSVNIKDVVARYPAIDEDTGKPAENVRYLKGSDPDNWITIDPVTAEIKLNKLPDRESPFLTNGTYRAEVLCITEDMPSKTATGTIDIQVEDFNDHCPTLTTDFSTMCTTVDAVIVSAEDKDAFPNGEPFQFDIIPGGTVGKWDVEHLNATAAILRAKETMWPGSYEVEFVVRDQQGEACPEPQKVKVHVCTCEDGVVCGARGAGGQLVKEAELGPAGIGLLLLGLLLLLLILLLLLFCQCGALGGLPGGFAEIPFDTKSHLIAYHTEGQGENTNVPLLTLPTQVEGGLIKRDVNMIMAPVAHEEFQDSATSIDGAFIQDRFQNGYGEDMMMKMGQARDSSFYMDSEGRGAGYHYIGIALPDHFLGQYYAQKVVSEGANQTAKDSLLVYDYEGQGSTAGSVGCCSDQASEDDLQFLNDLGPKFKTLAEVCGGKEIQTPVKQVPKKFSPPPHTAVSTETSVFAQPMAPPLPPQPVVPQPELPVIPQSSECSHTMMEGRATLREGMTSVKEGMTTVKEGIANQGQMVLLQQQQPIYYTSTPMLQPMHYIVQPQFQNTMMLAEAPSTNLQGMIMVNGTQTRPAQGLVVQGQTMMASSQAQGPGMVLVERSGPGNLSGSQPMTMMASSQAQGPGMVLVERSGPGNLSGSQTMTMMASSQAQGPGMVLVERSGPGNLSGSQTMMVLEEQIPVGSRQVRKGSQTRLTQGGILQQGGLSGSQRVLVVGGAKSDGGQFIQEAGGVMQMSGLSGSQKVLYSKGSTSAGSQSSVMGLNTTSTTVSTTPKYRKVVVQEKRVTE